MPTKCKKKGCNYNVFGKGFCKNHQYLRTDKKPNFLKRTPLKKKPKSATKRKQDKEQREKDRQFYLSIWEEREHRDFETNEPIFGEISTLYFHHVLPKHPGPGGYPQFRHKKWNIILVSWETHTNAETNLDLVPKIKAYRAKLLKTKVK